MTEHEASPFALVAPPGVGHSCILDAAPLDSATISVKPYAPSLRKVAFAGTDDARSEGHSAMPGEQRGERRVPLSPRISTAARNGWRGFARREGVTLTALLEVIGIRLADGSYEPNAAMRDVIEEAKQLDIERRDRGGPRVP